MTQNEDRPTRPVSPYLTKAQVRQLWDAGSFLAQEYGVLFNCRITIFHDRIGLQQRCDRTVMVSELVRRLGQRLRYWAPSNGERFHWLYVHENTSGKGLITTVVAYLPPHLEGDARHWLFKRFLAKQFPKVGSFAVRFTVVPKSEEPKLLLRRHLQLMRSVCRAADPSIRVSNLGHRRRLLDVLGLQNPSNETFLSTSGRRFEISEGLGAGPQRRASREGMEMLSALGDRAYHFLLTGWEIEEHQDRLRERAQRARDLAKVEVGWPKGNGKRLDQLRDLAAKKLYHGWQVDPRQRLRAWMGWWQDG